MQDVTLQLAGFRESLRHLWNTQVLGVLQTADDKWAVRDEFDDACSILFGILVAVPLNVARAENAGRLLAPNRSSGAAPLRWLRVVPNVPMGAPIMINRDTVTSSGYWDHPVDRVVAEEVDLRFVRWFDFDELSFRDFTNYQVRIVAARDAALVGRAAIIACEHVRVLLDPAEVPA